VLLTRMFDAYGQTANPSRIDSYLDVIGEFPLWALQHGIREAMREAGDFPPGPGTVRRCCKVEARAIHPTEPYSPREPGIDYEVERMKIAAIIAATKGATVHPLRREPVAKVNDDVF